MFALVKGFTGLICDVQLNVLCWSAAQCSMQCFADMALHRSHRVASSAAAMQVESAITNFTNLSHYRCGFGAGSAGFGRVLLPMGLG